VLSRRGGNGALATAVLVLTLWAPSLALAQSSAADELNKRVNELYRAGRYAEAIPSEQQFADDP
jgi:hypothetical protein